MSQMKGKNCIERSWKPHGESKVFADFSERVKEEEQSKMSTERERQKEDWRRQKGEEKEKERRQK